VWDPARIFPVWRSCMLVTVYPQASAFLNRTRGLLLKHEALNNLILGLSLRLLAQPERFKVPPYLATVEDPQGGVLIAGMTPPRVLLLATEGPVSTAALEALAQKVAQDGFKLPGVHGPVGMAKEFARIWCAQAGLQYHLEMRQRIYELRRVMQPITPNGRLRLATPGDLDLVFRWTYAFIHEAEPQSSPDDVFEIAETKIRDRQVYLWDTGRPAAMASIARPTPNGISIGLVYTPPELRGRGFASACVAALSQKLLNDGWKFCTLFTDLANPTSNDIYQRIGYLPLGDFDEYLFTQPES
jgi:predicted GNAT family acetyltransferase